MLSSIIVSFYRFWHGTLHLRGAGLLTRLASPYLPGLRSFPLKLPEGHTVSVDFRDVSSSYWVNDLLGDRFEEKGLLMAVLAHASEGSTVWDVGANCGLFSYRVSQSSKIGKLVFFEPNPAMFKLASKATSPFTKTVGMPYALSDKSGRASMTIPQGESTTGTLEAVRPERSCSTTVIECRTGDQLVEIGTLETPDVIKIDTEGHEMAVIQGLQNVIRENRPAIFFEHISLSDEEVLSLLPHGYSIFSVSDEDGSLSPGFNRERGHNSALLPTKDAA